MVFIFWCYLDFVVKVVGIIDLVDFVWCYGDIYFLKIYELEGCVGDIVFGDFS